ncbi:hypothetical protein AKJ09_04090 [Labilithrix luteola]|uniref:Uncharacterized protein n=1 Tax=Labilithrix luteola TaxID=1391654 RepID=A0A0K1PVM4_9BACT|nr:hypothetical protein AKJ09_04090 [Labilithrix luteola]
MLVACHRETSQERRRATVASVTDVDAGGPLPIPSSPSAPIDAGTQADAASATPDRPQKVEVGGESTLVRSMCLVQAACAKAGRLDRTAFVDVEPGGGQSCEESRPTVSCGVLAESGIGKGFLEEAGFGPVCACGVTRATDVPREGGGRPRGEAKAAIRTLAGKGPVPCANFEPAARLAYQIWCDTYRGDGTLEERSYFGQVNGGGERVWFQKLDRSGKATEEFRDCDSGHH